MSKMYEDLMNGLNDAIIDMRTSKIGLKRNTIHNESMINCSMKDVENKENGCK